MDEYVNEIIDEMKLFRIHCPECSSVDDDQYQCCTCGCCGGQATISIMAFLQRNESIPTQVLKHFNLCRLSNGEADGEIRHGLPRR